MRQNSFNPKTESDVSLYFSVSDRAVPSHQETMGEVVMEILKSGMTVNRQSICARLLSRMSNDKHSHLEQHHHELIAMLFGRDS